MNTTGNGHAAAAEAPEAPATPDRPEVDFEVVGVEPVDRAAGPTLRFRTKAIDTSGLEIFTVALVSQISIEPAKRSYDDATRARLIELFGEPERWAATTHSFPWGRTEALVPTFTGSTDFAIEVPCTYDLEVVASKYFYSLSDGFAPLAFHFTGSVIYRDGEGRIQIVQIAWDRLSRFKLPIETWKAMMDYHYPGGGWIRLDKPTLERLQDHKAKAGQPTIADAVNALLDDAQS